MSEIHFGVLPGSSGFKQHEWPQLAKQLESLGYSTVFKEDHYDYSSYDPITMLATAAAHTTTLNIGTLVFCVDFRHPTTIAQTAATLQIQSNKRYELGIGAGWTKAEYIQTGIRYDKPAIRIRRLDEALKIIKSMWRNKKTTFNGKHYQVRELDRTASLEPDEYPRILVGGGGKMLLGVAGKHADIVSIIPRLSSSWPPRSMKDFSLEGVKEKIRWVKDSALKLGRDPDDIEFALYSLGNVLIGDDVDDYVDSVSKGYGISGEEFLELPGSWVGSGSDIVDKLKHIHEETGITYFQYFIGGEDMINQLKLFSEQVIKQII